MGLGLGARVRFLTWVRRDRMGSVRWVLHGTVTAAPVTDPMSGTVRVPVAWAPDPHRDGGFGQPLWIPAEHIQLADPPDECGRRRHSAALAPWPLPRRSQHLGLPGVRVAGHGVEAEKRE